MKTLRKICIGALPIMQSLALLFALEHEGYFFHLLIAVVLLTDFCLTLFIPRTIPKRQLFLTSLPALALPLFSFGILFLLEYDILRNAVLILNVILGPIYLLNLYYNFYRPEKYQERSLFNINGTIQTLVFFYAAALYFGFIFYLDIQSWYLIIPFLLIVVTLFLQNLFVHKIQVRPNILFIIALVIIILELIFALSWLPTLYYINACVLTVFFYALSNLGIASMNREISRSQISTYFVLCGGMLLLVLSTAFWR